MKGNNMKENLSNEKMELLIKVFKDVTALFDVAVKADSQQAFDRVVGQLIKMHMKCSESLSDSDLLLLDRRLA